MMRERPAEPLSPATEIHLVISRRHLILLFSFHKNKFQESNWDTPCQLPSARSSQGFILIILSSMRSLFTVHTVQDNPAWVFNGKLSQDSHDLRTDNIDILISFKWSCDDKTSCDQDEPPPAHQVKTMTMMDDFGKAFARMKATKWTLPSKLWIVSLSLLR